MQHYAKNRGRAMRVGISDEVSIIQIILRKFSKRLTLTFRGMGRGG